jgi:hypothetical protein
MTGALKCPSKFSKKFKRTRTKELVALVNITYERTLKKKSCVTVSSKRDAKTP